MEFAMKNRLFNRKRKRKRSCTGQEARMVKRNNLTYASIDHDYIIESIDTDEQSIKDFLFTLGCFRGEKIMLISVLADNYIIHIKDARYSIDSRLAKAILIAEPV